MLAVVGEGPKPPPKGGGMSWAWAGVAARGPGDDPAMEIRVSSWGELQEQLFAESWQPELGLYRSHFAFRGGGDARAALTSPLARLGGDAASGERHLVRNFRKYAAQDAVPADS